VLVITFTLTVFVDLVVAVNVGVVVATLFFMRRMANTVNIEPEVLPHDTPTDATATHPKMSADVMIYRIEGPFFFGAAEKLASVLGRVQAHVKVVVLRMNQVPFMDATGLETLSEIIERFHKRKIRVVLCDVQPNVQFKLQRAGVLEKLGAQNLVRESQLASLSA
jgi:SulP family sulfate permease